MQVGILSDMPKACLSLPYSLERESISEPGVRAAARGSAVCLSCHGSYRYTCSFYVGTEDLNSGLLAV